MAKESKQNRIYSNNNNLTIIVNTRITHVDINPSDLEEFYIQVKEPQGMQRQLVISSHLIDDLTNFYSVKSYYDLKGKRVRAIYGQEKIIGIIPRKFKSKRH